MVVGYALLGAVVLWTGLPHIATDSHLEEMRGAIGAVGVGVTISVGAFFAGSLLDDVIGLVFHFRGARAFSTGSVDPFLAIIDMPDSVRSELERLEGIIDRTNSEARLRISLLIPLAVGTASAIRHDWWWLTIGIAVGGAFLFQFARRRTELVENLRASTAIREGWAARLREDQDQEKERRADEARQRQLDSHRRELELAKQEEIPF